MKPIDVSSIANGAVNIAIAGAQAKSSGMSASLAAHLYEDLRAKLEAQNVHVHVYEHPDDNIESGFRPHLREVISSAIGLAEESLKNAGLPARFHQKIERAKDELSKENFDAAVLSALFMEIVYDLGAELSEPMFLCVNPERRHLLEQKEPPFGLIVAAAFPESARDIAAATRCLALDEWTACVFHLMRALEAPLHKLADKIGVEFPTPLDLENWKNIIDAVESAVNRRVKEQENTKKSHERNDELKQLGEIAVLFRHFKNAWRNDAAHGREFYDEREAQQVYDGVSAFMQLMALAI